MNSYSTFRVEVEGAIGPVRMPDIEEGGLEGYLAFIEENFVTRPFAETGYKDFSGLLIDPMFSIPEDPIYDLALTWRLREPR